MTTSIIEKRHIQLGSTWIHYQTAGNGPPLVLVHGLASSVRWWQRNITALADHFRVYAIDLSNFGDRRFRPRFVLNQAAQYLARWLDALQIEAANFIGHSMGGRIAAELAAEEPDRVNRLVLVSPTIMPFSHGYLKQAWGMAHAFRRVPFSLFRMLFFDTLYTGIVPVMRIGQELLKSNLEHKIPHIQAPTLIIWGEHDTVVPLALGQALHQQLAGSQFKLIHDVGHAPMWENPQEFNQAALQFLVTS